MPTRTTSDTPLPGPVRQCAGCREREPAGRLLRLVREGEAVAPDVRRRVRGRGVNLHLRPSCLALAIKRRAVNRGLRAEVAVDGASLTSAIATALEEALRALLHDGTRSGAVVLSDDGQLGPPAFAGLVTQWEAVDQGLPWPKVRVVATPLAARVDWLAAGLSRFTFVDPSDMNRRPRQGGTPTAHGRRAHGAKRRHE